VLYDLAFLLMDLLHRDLPEAANAALASYLFHADTPDHLDALALLPLFLALRAAIRAMVSVQAGRLSDGDRSDRTAEARAYLKEARAHLTPPPPRLIALGGLSGTGKTTLAGRLAPHVGPAPGAIHLRSDLERKALFDVDPLTPLPDTAYTPEVSARVYDRLLDKARRILSAGHSVIVDAVFAQEGDRRRLDDLTQASGARLTGLWLTVDAETMIKRVEARQGDASDADAAVVRRQLAQSNPAPDWAQVDASGTPEATLTRALRRLDAP
jgi:predicted kinase